MAETLESLWRQCRDALGGQYRLVPGEGNPHAAVALVGEAPGAQEEAQGRPFVGAAGKNLDALLAMAGLTREALYVTNAVKFRPTRPGAGARLRNRSPTREEVARFAPWLRREIAAVSPRVVVTLGNVPLQAVTGTDLTVGRAHGRLLPCGAAPPVFALYHPASVIYRPQLRGVLEADMRALAGWLARAGREDDIWDAEKDI